MKKILSFVLALCMICTLLPATALTAAAADTTVVFQLGANGSASHNDGSSKTSYTETVSGYTLTLTNVSNFYTGARDLKGNGCIKLGASSKTGGFSFTAPDDVTKVIIAIAGYKSKSVTVKINNVSYPVSELSDSGAYKNIEIDTTTNKTVTLITTNTGYRAMVNSITYVIAGSSEPDVPDCEHTNTEDIGTPKDATCTEPGITAGEKCADCGEVITAQKETPAKGHSYDVNGVCSVCGTERPQVKEESYTFANFATGTQYAVNEEHKLSDIVTMYTTQSHFTEQLRIYSSSTRDGYAIIQSMLPITSIAFNAGYQVDTLNIYGRNADTEEWVLIQGVSITATTYKDYGPVEISPNYTQLKLDVAGANQVRIKSIKLEFAAAAPEAEPVAEFIPADGSESVKYTSWEEALENDVAGELKLLADLEIDKIDLDNLVIDLNGNALTVTTLNATVKDSSNGSGLIKVDEENKDRLTSVDDQLILWDNNVQGYRVFTYTFEDKDIDADGTDAEESVKAGCMVKSFWCDLTFTNDKAYELIETSDLNVGFMMSLDNGVNYTYFQFDRSGSTDPVAEWADAEANNTENKDYCFYITVTGFEGLEESGELLVKPYITTTYNTVEAGVMNLPYTTA